MLDSVPDVDSRAQNAEKNGGKIFIITNSATLSEPSYWNIVFSYLFILKPQANGGHRLFSEAPLDGTPTFNGRQDRSDPMSCAKSDPILRLEYSNEILWPSQRSQYI